MTVCLAISFLSMFHACVSSAYHNANKYMRRYTSCMAPTTNVCDSFFLEHMATLNLYAATIHECNCDNVIVCEKNERVR